MAKKTKDNIATGFKRIYFVLCAILAYVLLKDINDTKEEIQQLVKLCKQIPSKVNFIEYNEVENTQYKKTDKKTVEEILRVFDNNKITAKFRQSRGEDINAACGQLATKNIKT